MSYSLTIEVLRMSWRPAKDSLPKDPLRWTGCKDADKLRARPTKRPTRSIISGVWKCRHRSRSPHMRKPFRGTAPKSATREMPGPDETARYADVG